MLHLRRSSAASDPLADSPLTDEEIVARVLAGDVPLFEILMRRHNQRLYRVIRGVLRNESEVEDAMQQAYVQAYANLRQFAGAARFSTWLCRIGLHEALARRRGAGRLQLCDPEADVMETIATTRPTEDPESRASRRQLADVLESTVDELPEIYRVVFLLREVEGMSTAEAAAALELSEEAIKVRLHRARSHLRDAIAAKLEGAAGELFPFLRPRCDRVVNAVFERIRALPP
jgi:RNA polymerase sigma-70 factor (ECF subfamily)